MVMVCAWIGRLLRKKIDDGADLCNRCLLLMAAVFLLSPTQFPWYYIWLIPFLAETSLGRSAGWPTCLHALPSESLQVRK